MSGQETPGLVLDLTPDPTPASAGAGWGSLREIGGWWGLLRFLPGAVRQAFSGREPVGGLPVVEPGQTRSAELPETDFGDSYPTADHTLTAETDLATEAGLTVEAGAETATAEAGAAAEAGTVEIGEQLREEWLAGQDAGTELQDLIEARAAEEAEQGYEAWLAQEQADFDAGTGPYAADPTDLAQVAGEAGAGPNGQAQVAVAQAGAELGEAGLEAGL
jgi:hypothetical protein